MGAKIEPELTGEEPSTAPKMPDKRSLSEAEIESARKVFGASIKYESVRIEKMGGFTELINGSRAYTLGNTINLPGKVHAYPHKYVSIIIH
jgi:hypothetical protein